LQPTRTFDESLVSRSSEATYDAGTPTRSQLGSKETEVTSSLIACSNSAESVAIAALFAATAARSDALFSAIPCLTHKARYRSVIRVSVSLVPLSAAAASASKTSRRPYASEYISCSVCFAAAPAARRSGSAATSAGSVDSQDIFATSSSARARRPKVDANVQSVEVAMQSNVALYETRSDAASDAISSAVR
jgi:hypothetical protein